MALFRAKFACILAISNPVFRWESCKGSVWRIAQDCAKKQGLAAESRRWLTAASRQNDAHVLSMPKAEASRQLLHYRTKFTSWPGHLLAAWTRDSTQLRGQVARTPCLEKTNFSHSFSPYYIYTLIPTI